VAHWDADGRKDLLFGTPAGTVILYRNVATNAAPAFDAGALVEAGPEGGKEPIDVGYSATPLYEDWNGDGRRDLVVGAHDGRIHLYLNSGEDLAPDFLFESFAQEDGANLAVPTGRASPLLADWDGDAVADLVTGNEAGQLLFYRNVGTTQAPAFSGHALLTSQGAVIDLFDNAHTHPCRCDWTGDGAPDLVVGATDGLVHLFQDDTGTAAGAAPPPPARLLAPWPHPANPSVTVAFELDAPGRARLTVLDAAGRRVALLAEGTFPAGRHAFTWRGRDGAGRPLPSGVYRAVLTAGGRRQACALVLLR